ncbi:hypothetical protein, partial [Gordonia aurantiaca]|uniref:hypothetical protein n=1 Tax=Gordonia sp. B21 TaxID=3151852 RepID=UPI0032648B8A
MFDLVTTRLPGIVPYSSAVWTAADPDTGLPSSPTLWEAEASSRADRWRRQMGRGEVLDCAALGRMAHSAGARRARPRELRAVLGCEDAPWALVSLRRNRDEQPFTPADEELLARLAEPLGRQVRRLVRAGLRRGPEGPLPAHPGLLVFDRELDLVATGDAVSPWLSALGDEAHVTNPFGLPVPMWIVAAAARALQCAQAGGPGRIGVRAATVGERWLLAQASVIHDADGRPTSVGQCPVGWWTLGRRGFTRGDQRVMVNARRFDVVWPRVQRRPV